MMKVQVISRENIQPLSPTPNHLKKFNLSLLDQLIPAPYAPIVLFYPNLNDVRVCEKSTLLKKSLAQTLSSFYPLAGRFKDELSIDCNDQGVNYVTTNVNSHLIDFLNEPNLESIGQFLPCQPPFKELGAGDCVTNIQMNVFKCGGIAIGLCIAHKVLDGAGLSTFLKNWAGLIQCPNLMANYFFPAEDLWLRDTSMTMWSSIFKKGNFVTKRFVFNDSAIDNLKRMSTSPHIKYPTKVEVVSSFIWKCLIAASKEKNCSNKSCNSLLTHIVNLRKRAAPALPENILGNLIWISSAKNTAKRDMKLPDLVNKVKKSISRIDDCYIKRLRSDEGCSLMRKSLKEIGDFCSKGANHYGFSSWCKFGFYDIDFGFGKPIWVSTISSKCSFFMNLIILMESSACVDGIEAWVTLDEEEMNMLVGNQELLVFASIDPSPLPLYLPR
ncbi:stemmadenine O-acetyltransferase-like [Solanum dulcamara]|uniref:stemmadenine O-acetyltransferase-like n=1 Tax=Solanum dulcamara TaxID=45834 RepID=UPI0024859B31|nr:stemmadenine O-acetyltransferase-like [Solanum dulcamara]